MSSNSSGRETPVRKRPNVSAISGAASPSPAKGAGAQLKANSTPASPTNKPANDFGKNVQKDPLTGKTIVKLQRYSPFDTSRLYKADVLKTAKYTKKWVKRHLTYQDRLLGYAMAEGQTAKHSLVVSKVTRGAENGMEPLCLVVEGTGTDSKPAQFVFKLEKLEEFEVWYLRLCQSLAHYQLMEMPKDGFPLFNPRTGIPFVDVPLELLQVFHPLDRLVLHHFSKATVKHVVEGKHLDKVNVVFIGDLCLYVCEMDANMRRSIPVKDIHRLITADDDGVMTIGVQCNLPEFDLMFSLPPDQGELFVKVLCTLHFHHGAKTGTRLKREKYKLNDIKPQLSLEPNEFYELKIGLPMSKKFMMKLVADGIADKHLAVQDVTENLAPGTTAVAAPPTNADVPKPAEPTAERKKSLSRSDSGNSIDLGSKKIDMDGPRDQNPLKQSQPPPKPRIELTDTDDDDDFKPRANPKVQNGSPLANFKTAARTEAPNSIGSSGAITVAAGVDKMQRLLNHVRLPQYYAVLTERAVDWDVFSCMDALDLKAKGVTSVEHQIIIENALNDPKLMHALQQNDGLPPPRPTAGVPPPPPPPPGNPPAFIDDDDL